MECRRCGEDKPEGEFYPRNLVCKSCIRKRRKERYWEDPDKARQASLDWHHENREQANAGRQKRHRRDHPEVQRVRGQRQSREELNAKKRAKRRTPEERAKNRAYRQANRDQRAAYQRRWRQANLEYARAKGREAQRRRKLDYNAESIEYADIVEADPCVYCGGASETLEHIECLAGGGTNHWTNLAGACLGCNSSKNDKPLVQYLLDRQ